VPGLVRTVPVIVPCVGPQYRSQMGFAVDQHPVVQSDRTVRTQRSA
jgi:hypothetical protein